MKISIVCPYYNEEMILAEAMRQFVANLSTFEHPWELILVDDGSLDKSYEIARRTRMELSEYDIRLLHYGRNQGRGHALRTGIDEAVGDLIVTTEIDLSWGECIVHDIVQSFSKNPKLDAVVASPNISGGGYRNVPWGRVAISKIGNLIFRVFFTKRITMNTGMTRGYRREVIQSIETFEKGKEFHLEVLLKLFYLDFNVTEVPAILEWRAHRLSVAGAGGRKSSSNIPKLILSHLNFAVFANPIRYFWLMGIICAIFGAGMAGYVVHQLVVEKFSMDDVIVMLLLWGLTLLFFGFGVVTSQNIRLLKQTWIRKR